MKEHKEIKIGDWVELTIWSWGPDDFTDKVKVLGFNEEGVKVWNGVNEHADVWNIVWADIDKVKKLKA